MNAQLFQHHLLKNYPSSFEPWQASLGHISVGLLIFFYSVLPVCMVTHLSHLSLEYCSFMVNHTTLRMTA